MNFEGLRRRGFTPERISAVKAMHKAMYRDGLTLEQAQAQIAALTGRYPEAAPDVTSRSLVAGVKDEEGRFIVGSGGLVLRRV